MKVLQQDWYVPDKGCMTSISKDQTQLDTTFEEIKIKEPETELDGQFQEITIPDDSVFAEMVQTRTVFLHDDEMDIIYDCPENN